nr:hypothetical protein [Tanacetum cinerariifolium]
MELWVELKRLYEPDVEDQLWTHTQNMMHALVEWKLYDSCGVHHVTSKDNEIFMLIEKDYPLRKGLAIMMICYKLQVENYSQMARLIPHSPCCTNIQTKLLILLPLEITQCNCKYQDNYAKVHKYQSQQRKPWSKKQKRDYCMAVIKSNLGWKVKDFRGMTFKEIKAKFTTVWKQIKNFIPMSLKEEAERFKGKGIRFKQESVKKLKTSEEVKASKEVPEEKVKEM